MDDANLDAQNKLCFTRYVFLEHPDLFAAFPAVDRQSNPAVLGLFDEDFGSGVFSPSCGRPRGDPHGAGGDAPRSASLPRSPHG